MAEFIPLIINGANQNPPLERIQAEADRLGVTHVRSNSGQVEKIFSKLNRRSVSLNNGGNGTPRWPWSRVGALGTLAER